MFLTAMLVFTILMLAAEKHKGSWWARWGEWLAGRSGPMIPAREPGDAAHPPIAPAPGTYVTAVPTL